MTGIVHTWPHRPWDATPMTWQAAVRAGRLQEHEDGAGCDPQGAAGGNVLDGRAGEGQPQAVGEGDDPSLFDLDLIGLGLTGLDWAGLGWT